MNRKVLITGCNGFIGSHLVNLYISKGYEVYGIDVINSKSSMRNCKFMECNLLDDDLSETYREISPDIFIHCAGNASVATSVKYPEMDFDSNVSVLYKTLSSLSRANINPRFIFLSTAAVYGNPKQLPISEKTIAAPISPYGLHKKMCEDLCHYYREVKGHNISVVRIFSAYGEGLRKQILWDMYNKYKNKGYIELFGTGNETRDFINIYDLVQALDLIINDEKTDFVYNVANGEEISIKTLALEYANILGLDDSKIIFNGEVKKGDPLNWKADITKLSKLGYKQRKNLREGLKNYIDWVKKFDRE
ncbi:NAD-dependent epimerase/dehydratase family protein [Clostridium sp. HBUAS56017]|uniref:NAD-dependent epimerase/dehydratase family protein n=1 Tax=Clostridium sp. HBUAS56017 TaxID=2571128 RepID=UPI00117750DE|nr:NAD-dependent epimerase/dehydratase family protein [Clostridium sp. HBUAS56017]